MMNFRYHVVSLIAVFLALAIGVLLGAGPLQSRIARSVETPASQAAEAESAALRAAQLRASLDAKGVAAIANKIVGTHLNGANVVTVALPGTDTDDIASARTALTQAGAKIAGSVALTDNWDIQGMDQYRQTLSTSLSTRIPNIPNDASGDDIIGYAIVNVLTTVGAERDIAFEILTDDTTPILTITDDPQGGAHSIVVIGPRDTDQGLVPEEENGVVRSVSAWVGLARAIATAPKSGIFVGDALEQNSMLTQIRAQKVPVTTIDQVGTEIANLAMVASLPTATRQERAYGFGEGATEALPQLPKID